MAKCLPMERTDDLIGTIEAAQVIGCDRSALTRWVQLGRITQAMKLPGENGVRLFRRSDVEAFRDAYQSERAS